VYSTVCEVSGE